MEKRKVRIYKAHDGEGKYINKTKQFLEKAQMGMQTQNESADVEQQLQSVKYYIKGLKNESVDDNQILKVLVSKGLRKDIATALILQVSEELEEQERKLEEEDEANAENQPNAEETEMGQEEQADVEEQPEEEEDESAGYNEAIAEDDDYMNPNMEYGYGGRVGKKKFTNNVLKLLKKQEGGEEKALGQGYRFDNMNNDASTKKSSFLEKIKETSNKAAVDELYEKMMQSNNPELIESANKMAEERNKPAEGTFEEAQSGGFIGGDDQPDIFMYGGTEMPFYEADFLPEAQKGIISGKAYNAKTREEYKDSFEGLDPYAKTVHKRGLFGRPKQWTEYYTKGKGSAKSLTPGQEIQAAYEKQLAEKSQNLKHGVEKEVWDDLSGKAKRAIRRGERQLGREARRGEDSLAEDAAFNKGVHARYKYDTEEDLARDLKRSDDAWDKDESFVSDIDNSIKSPYKGFVYNTHDPRGNKYEEPRLVAMPELLPYGLKEADFAISEIPLDDNVPIEELNDIANDFKEQKQAYDISKLNNEHYVTNPKLLELQKSSSRKEYSNFKADQLENMYNTKKEFAPRMVDPKLSTLHQFMPGKSRATKEEESMNKIFDQREAAEDDDLKNEKYGFRYGGLPKAQTGPPVKKPSDPSTNTGDLSGMLKPAQNPNTLLGASQSFPGMPSNTPVNPDAGKVKTVTMDPNQTKGQTITSEDFGDPSNDDIIAVDKQKAPSNFDGEDAVNKFNAGATAVTGFLNNLDTAKQQKEMYDNNFTSDNMYASTNTKDRGDYVDYGQQLGQFRYDQMGSDTSGRFAYGQTGGYMQEGGYAEGDEVFMTDEELEEFLANGGDVEYL